jgi:lysophospholipase L1-like esterase
MSAGYRLADPQTQSWPAILVHTHPELGRLVNLAIPGYGFFKEGTVPDGPQLRATSQTLQAIAADPTLIIIWMGINDLHHPQYSVADVTQQLDRMLGTLEVTGARLFVINEMDARAMDPHVWNPRIERSALEYNQTMLPVLARHHATLIDMYQETQAIWGNPADVLPQAAPHPSVAGTTAIAEVVYRALHQAGVL